MTVFFVCAIIVEFIVELIKKPIAAQYTGFVVPILSIIVGLVIAFGTKQGIFTLIGVPFAYDWLDYILTGLAYSGGSRSIHELIRKVTSASTTKFDE